MTEAYTITVSYIAENDAEAERVRSDLIDYMVSRGVCELAEIRPIRKLGEEETQLLLEDAPTDEDVS